MNEVAGLLEEEYGYEDTDPIHGLFTTGSKALSGSTSGNSLSLDQRLTVPSYRKRKDSAFWRRGGGNDFIRGMLSFQGGTLSGQSGGIDAMVNNAKRDNNAKNAALVAATLNDTNFNRTQVPGQATFEDVNIISEIPSKGTNEVIQSLTIPVIDNTAPSYKNSEIQPYNTRLYNKSEVYGFDGLLKTGGKNIGSSKDIEAEGGEYKGKVNDDGSITWLKKYGDNLPSHSEGGVKDVLHKGEFVLNKLQMARLGNGEKIGDILMELPNVGNEAQIGLLNDGDEWWQRWFIKPFTDVGRYYSVSRYYSDRIGEKLVAREIQDKFGGNREKYYEYIRAKYNLPRNITPAPSSNIPVIPSKKENVELSATPKTGVTPAKRPTSEISRMPSRTETPTIIPNVGVENEKKKTILSASAYRPKEKESNENKPFELGPDELVLAANALQGLSVMLQPKPEDIRKSPTILPEPSLVTPSRVNMNMGKMLDNQFKTGLNYLHQTGQTEKIPSLISAMSNARQEAANKEGVINTEIMNKAKDLNAQTINQFLMAQGKIDDDTNKINTQLEKEQSLINFQQMAEKAKVAPNNLMAYAKYLQDLKDKERQQMYDSLMFSKMFTSR